MKELSVLFVCMGNICRSPTAAGVFRQLAKEAGYEDRIRIDSAATHGYNVGSPPDRRSYDTALEHGIDIGEDRARVVNGEDLSQTDYIVAMDSDNLRVLRDACPRDGRSRIHRILDFAPTLSLEDVPDPYMGGEDGFKHVYDLIEAGARGLLHQIQQDHSV